MKPHELSRKIACEATRAIEDPYPASVRLRLAEIIKDAEAITEALELEAVNAARSEYLSAVGRAI